MFHGLKITADANAARELPNLVRVKIKRQESRIITDHPGVIADGGNSGYQAINLAVQFGVRRIILIGFDLRLDLGTHWHGRHPKGLNNPGEKLVERWRRTIDNAAPRLRAFGVEVLNASAVSALINYPKVSLEAI